MEFNALDAIDERFAVAVGQMRRLSGLRSRDGVGPGQGVSQRDQAQRFERKTCRDETSLTTRTMVEETKVLRTTRFLAIPRLRQARTRCSATVVIARLAGRYAIDWRIDRWLVAARDLRKRGSVYHDNVQFDEAYLDGQRRGGKGGRGVANR